MAKTRETAPELYDVRPGNFDGTIFVPSSDGLVIPLLDERDLYGEEA